jgi:hypothetical protein
MRRIKAVYDGRPVKLLEPVDLPANTPLEVVVKNKPAAKGKRKDPWERLGENAIDMGVSDLAEQHDHYLYGVPKHRRST